jgi:hypothetical protein
MAHVQGRERMYLGYGASCFDPKVVSTLELDLKKEADIYAYIYIYTHTKSKVCMCMRDTCLIEQKDGSVLRWDLKKGDKRRIFPVTGKHGPFVHSLAVSSDGR